MLAAGIILIALCALLILLIFFLIFMLWVFREHQFANRYREAERIYNEQIKNRPNLGPHWLIDYKEGRKVSKFKSQQPTEGEAVKEFTRQFPYAKITSVSRVT